MMLHRHFEALREKADEANKPNENGTIAEGADIAEPEAPKRGRKKAAE